METPKAVQIELMHNPLSLKFKSQLCNPATENEFGMVMARSEETTADMEVIFRDDEDPYYSFRWPTSSPKPLIADIIQSVGERFGATRYICMDDSPRSTNHCGELSEEERIAIDEYMGESPDLNKVIKEDFTFLRVECSDFAMIWSSYNPFDPESDLFGIIADDSTPITADWLTEAMDQTLQEEMRASVSVVAETFEEARKAVQEQVTFEWTAPEG